MKAVHIILALMFFLNIPHYSRGDEPPAPAATYVKYSTNKSFYFESNKEKNKTYIFRDMTLLWKIDGWHRIAFLTNDGKHFIAGYDGINLIPQSIDSEGLMSTEILKFYTKGKLIKSVPLKEIIESADALKKTVSHYHWGNFIGFNDKGSFEVQTIDEKTIQFDPATGNIIN